MIAKKYLRTQLWMSCLLIHKKNSKSFISHYCLYKGDPSKQFITHTSRKALNNIFHFESWAYYSMTVFYLFFGTFLRRNINGQHFVSRLNLINTFFLLKSGMFYSSRIQLSVHLSKPKRTRCLHRKYSLLKYICKITQGKNLLSPFKFD